MTWTGIFIGLLVIVAGATATLLWLVVATVNRMLVRLDKIEMEMIRFDRIEMDLIEIRDAD